MNISSVIPSKKKVYDGITDETQISDEKLVDGMFLGILVVFKLLKKVFFIHWLSEYSVNVFQFSINDFMLILVGNTIALKTQKSSCKKKKKQIGTKIESANERSGNM